MKSKKAIFTTEEVIAVTLANHKALQLDDYDWKKYLLVTPLGFELHDKLFWSLTDRQENAFEECMEVADDDVGEYIDKLWERHGEFLITPEENVIRSWSKEDQDLWTSIEGYTQAAFDDFIE